MGIAACGCGKTAYTPKIDEQAQECIDLMTKKPELKHYREDQNAIKNMEILY